MEKVWRVAVLGGGFIGQAHIAALRQMPNVSIVMLADHDREKARHRAAFWNIPRWSVDWHEAVADPTIDVVHNCLPNDEHLAVLRACLDGQKPLFAEKPLTRTWEEARELQPWLAKPASALVGVNFNYRYYPMVTWIREQIGNHGIGTPFWVRAQYLQDWLAPSGVRNWRLDESRGGPLRAMGDIGSHALDLSEFILDDRITRVFARLGSMPRSNPVYGDDIAVVLVETARNVTGVVTVSQVSAGHKNDLEIEVSGTEGALAWAQENPELVWRGTTRASNEEIVRQQDFAVGWVNPHPYPVGHVMGWSEALRLSIEAFYHDLAHPDEPARRVPLEAGVHSMALLEAVRKSHIEQQWVTVEP
jgi:predicted dehydrogenase